MKIRHLLTALFGGLIIYFALLLSQGPHSAAQLAELEKYRLSLENNLGDLEQAGDDLEARYYELRDDKSALIREANRIGMVFPGDDMIQEYGRERTVQSLSPGQLLSLKDPAVNRHPLFRAIALSAAMVILVLLIIIDPPESRGKRERDTSRSRSTGRTAHIIAMGSVGSDVEMGQSIRIQVAARE